jgi:hypothetical protein
MHTFSCLKAKKNPPVLLLCRAITQQKTVQKIFKWDKMHTKKEKQQQSNIYCMRYQPDTQFFFQIFSIPVW